jgi:head-tail adaptor
MRSGLLRHRLLLQSKSQIRDANGELNPYDESVWATDRTVWGSVASSGGSVSGREFQWAQQMYPEGNYIVTVRHQPGYHSAQRFLYPDESTTLGASIDTVSETSVTLATAILGSTKSDQYIKIDSEFMIVTGGNGTTSLTVTRGAFGTTKATHSNAATVLFHKVLNIGAVLNMEQRDRTTVLACKDVT